MSEHTDLMKRLEAAEAELYSIREEIAKSQPVPLSEQVWTARENISGNFNIYYEEKWLATAYDEATRDIILAVPELVKAVIEYNPRQSVDVERALRKMGVVE